MARTFYFYNIRSNFVIVGDFNIDIIKVDYNCYSKSFNNLLTKFNLDSVIKSPTRITETSITQIDHVIIPKTSKDKIKLTGCIDYGLSDHHLVYCVYNIFKEKPKPVFKIIRNFKNVDIDKLRNDIYALLLGKYVMSLTMLMIQYTLGKNFMLV